MVKGVRVVKYANSKLMTSLFFCTVTSHTCYNKLSDSQVGITNDFPSKYFKYSFKEQED